MVDGTNPNQGWRWGELDRAIAGLPEGPLRVRQRTHFDALTLLAVFLQHGDRKPEQQRLGCRGNLDTNAGEVGDRGSHSASVFFERRDAVACPDPVVAIQDVGATFGGAGRLSSSTTATMHLRSWVAHQVFRPAQRAPAGVVPECRGSLTISAAAGENGEANPRVGEAGRRFLLERLQQLTDAHLRALFASARIDKLPEPQHWQDPRSGTAYTGLDAWVAAFNDKVRQIEERRCAP